MESGFSALKGRKALARGAALGTSDLRFAPSPRREVVRSGEPASRAGESGGSVGVSPGAPELNQTPPVSNLRRRLRQARAWLCPSFNFLTFSRYL